MLKLQYFGHLMQKGDSLEKILMLGKIEGKRWRGCQKMRWTDSITNSMDINLSKLWKIVEDWGALCAAVHAVTKSQTQLDDWTTTATIQPWNLSRSTSILNPFPSSLFATSLSLFQCGLLSGLSPQVKVKSLSHVRLFATPCTVAHQAPPSMGFSRQEYWSGLPFPSPGDLPDPEIEPRSPAFQADALTSEPPGKPYLLKAQPKCYQKFGFPKCLIILC